MPRCLNTVRRGLRGRPLCWGIIDRDHPAIDEDVLHLHGVIEDVPFGHEQVGDPPFFEGAEPVAGAGDLCGVGG